MNAREQARFDAAKTGERHTASHLDRQKNQRKPKPPAPLKP
jgi:hypothetical protein